MDHCGSWPSALWLAQVASMIGTWMTVGAPWLRVGAPGAETPVALLHVATPCSRGWCWPAGRALAHILDRRRMLIGLQLFQTVVAEAFPARPARQGRKDRVEGEARR